MKITQVEPQVAGRTGALQQVVGVGDNSPTIDGFPFMSLPFTSSHLFKLSVQRDC